MQQDLTDQQRERHKALEELVVLGINPFPPGEFEVNVSSRDIHENYTRDKLAYKNISIAGRLMSRRIMGNASFAGLQDSTGRIQIYIKRDEICPGENKSLYNTVFKHLVDIGDIIGVKGYVFTTQVGEITIHVTQFNLLAKSLRPLPVVKTDSEGNIHDLFKDVELRYRQRYVDLAVNDQVRGVFVKRSRIIKSMRDFLDGKGYLEVETPVLQPIYGGARARPFKTHHNALDVPLYLRIANELYLKRLIVGGFDGVYEFAKDFRNEGMDRFHNPEFTQMELYVAFKDYYWMMNLVEEMVEKVATDLQASSQITFGGQVIDFSRPWKRYTMYEAIKKFTGINIEGMNEPELASTAKKLNVHFDSSGGVGHIIDEIFSATCEPHLIQPTFITDYPVEMSPLAKKHRSKPGLVERFEAICNGKELCNAFSELNDPIDQRQRFEEQLKMKERGDEEAMVLDDDFLRALEYGMPPTAGLGIGIDRLVMIMTDSPSIQDVLLFPQMKPEKK